MGNTKTMSRDKNFVGNIDVIPTSAVETLLDEIVDLTMNAKN